MNYSIEKQERKTRRKALIYTIIITLLLFGSIMVGTSGSFSNLTESVKSMINGDIEAPEEVADLESRRP